MPRVKSPETRAKDAERQRTKFKNVGYAATLAEHAAFKAWCERHGTTMHAVLRAHVQSCLAQDEHDKAPEE